MNQSKTKILVTSSVMIALGIAVKVVCDLIPFLNLPFGGTVTICSMLPVVLVSWMYGIKNGLKAAAVYAVLRVMLSYNTVAGLFTPTSDSYMGLLNAILILTCDYLLAYIVLGFGGMFKNRLGRTSSLVLGSAVVLFASYIMHTVSGAVFYGAWAEWFFTDTVFASLPVSAWIMDTFSGAGLAIVYSAVYNGCYMLPEIIITAIGAAAVSRLPFIK